MDKLPEQQQQEEVVSLKQVKLHSPGHEMEQQAADPLLEINSSRTELLGRVQTLKKELQDWREKLDCQVKNYRQELGDLRSTLNCEVEQLRNEFQDLRTSLKRQLDTAASPVPAPDGGTGKGPEES